MQEAGKREITIDYLSRILGYIAGEQYKEESQAYGPDEIKEPDNEFHNASQWIEDQVEYWMDEYDNLTLSVGDHKDKKEVKSVRSSTALIESLYANVPVGSSFNLSPDTEVTAVPGGWIHTTKTQAGVSSVFVPDQIQFQ